MSWDIALYALAVLLVAVGIVGTVLPALPGPTLVWVGLLLAAWTDDFTRIGGAAAIGLTVLAALTWAVDFAASAFGARRLGASRRAVAGAVLGTLVGIFFGLPGLILGPFIGAVVGEYTVQRDLEKAGRAGFGAWIGVALGAAAKLALVFSMLAIFGVAWFA